VVAHRPRRREDAVRNHSPGVRTYIRLASSRHVELPEANGGALHRRIDVSVTMTIAVFGDPVGKITDIPYTTGMNVQQVMEAAYDQASPAPVSFVLQYFGHDLGYEIIAIDNVASQNGAAFNAFTFWALSINGVLSPTGIDETLVSDGDQIEWAYVAYSEAEHAGTRFATVRRRMGMTTAERR
jgi:Domain of unknown function (DUF4430)